VDKSYNLMYFCASNWKTLLDDRRGYTMDKRVRLYIAV